MNTDHNINTMNAGGDGFIKRANSIMRAAQGKEQTANGDLLRVVKGGE